MSASTAELVMSLLADGPSMTRPLHIDLVIDELDSPTIPEAGMAIPTIWCKVSDATPLEVAVS